MSTSIGKKVEEFAYYGFPPGRTYSAVERAEIIEYALGFEECNALRSELEAMSDTNLNSTAYWAMAEYARGQQ